MKTQNSKEINSSSNAFKEINSKIEKEKQMTKDWLAKNKEIKVNGKSLEELAGFKL